MWRNKMRRVLKKRCCSSGHWFCRWSIGIIIHVIIVLERLTAQQNISCKRMLILHEYHYSKTPPVNMLLQSIWQTRPFVTVNISPHLLHIWEIQTLLNTLRPRQNGRFSADDTFKHIFLNENIRISIKISLKFVPKGLINNIPVLVLIMAWRRSGDKPLSEPMMVRSLTHICVTRPQWVNRHFINWNHDPI